MTRELDRLELTKAGVLVAELGVGDPEFTFESI